MNANEQLAKKADMVIMTRIIIFLRYGQFSGSFGSSDGWGIRGKPWLSSLSDSSRELSSSIVCFSRSDIIGEPSRFEKENHACGKFCSFAFNPAAGGNFRHSSTVVSRVVQIRGRLHKCQPAITFLLYCPDRTWLPKIRSPSPADVASAVQKKCGDW